MTPEETHALQSTSAQLQRIFDDDRLVIISNMEELHERLTEKIIDLMMHHMEKLLQILYRIDVNERKVKACFGQNDPKLIAPTLASLIIEREIEKYKSRMAHRKP